MKFYFLMGILLIPGLLFSQVKDKPFAHSNLIIVDTPDESSTAYENLMDIFINHGYRLETRDDANMLFIVTKKLDNQTTNHVSVTLKENDQEQTQLNLSGRVVIDEVGDERGIVQWLPDEENNILNDAYKSMREVAQGYPEGEVSYGQH